MRLLLIASSAMLFALSSCSSSSNPNNFPSFQACFDEHTTKESFSPACAIEICCIDHGIGNAKMNTVCGDTTQSCQTYVTANVTDAADTMLTTDITTACTDYPFDSGRTTTGSGGMCGS